MELLNSLPNITTTIVLDGSISRCNLWKPVRFFIFVKKQNVYGRKARI